MIIKAWNNSDFGVYKINDSLERAYEKFSKPLLAPEVEERLGQIAGEVAEEIGVVFVHQLSPGWEEKILESGCVLTKGGAVISNVEFMHEVLSRDGEIQFYYCAGRETAAEFLQTLKVKQAEIAAAKLRATLLRRARSIF